MDPARQIACHAEFERASAPDASTVEVWLREMSHGPVRFRGRYTYRLRREADVVRWSTDPGGNPVVEGTARFLPAPGGARMEIDEEVRTEIEVNRLLGGVLRPVAEGMMTRGMKGFAERMAADLERLGPGPGARG